LGEEQESYGLTTEKNLTILEVKRRNKHRAEGEPLAAALKKRYLERRTSSSRKSLLRVRAGFFMSFAYTWIVYIPGIFPTERRSACFGWTSTVARISYVVGPALAAILLRLFPTVVVMGGDRIGDAWATDDSLYRTSVRDGAT
jgi:hypothetical protein